MPHRTQVESDGKTVYILSGTKSGGWADVLWVLTCWVLLLCFFGWVLRELFREPGGWILSFLLFKFAIYPVLRRMSRSLLAEEVCLSTQTMTIQRRYAFIRGRKQTRTYHEGQLATGAEALDRHGKQLQISWYTDVPDGHKPQLLYRHFLPMTPANYEQAKAYLQELYDLEEESHFELLFSAN